jgi:hypothetical protein
LKSVVVDFQGHERPPRLRRRFVDVIDVFLIRESEFNKHSQLTSTQKGIEGKLEFTS